MVYLKEFKMNKKIILSIASVAVLSTSAFATNGTNLIGYGVESRAMGGTGVSVNRSATAAFDNPALLTQSKSALDISIGGTILSPTVSYEDNSAGGITKSEDSTAGSGIIPAVAVNNKVNNKVSWGLSMYGTGGMGVDYRDATTTQQASAKSNDNLMAMRLTIPIAYQVINGLSFGIAPVMEYGALAMNGGISSDIAYGYEVGAAYKIDNIGLAFGVDYKSEIEHQYKNTFNSDFTGGTQDKLSSPSVISVGTSYQYNINPGNYLTAAFDYKMIGYGDAVGIKDFGWENQNVFAVGLEYQSPLYALRAGYNYGASPVETDAAKNPFGSKGSLMAFPAVTESHITLGGSFNATNTLSVDVAYVLGKGEAELENGGGYTAKAINNQNSFTVSMNYSFK